jgi:hypothetical protein
MGENRKRDIFSCQMSIFFLAISLDGQVTFYQMMMFNLY